MIALPSPLQTYANWVCRVSDPGPDLEADIDRHRAALDRLDPDYDEKFTFYQDLATYVVVSSALSRMEAGFIPGPQIRARLIQFVEAVGEMTFVNQTQVARIMNRMGRIWEANPILELAELLIATVLEGTYLPGQVLMITRTLMDLRIQAVAGTPMAAQLTDTSIRLAQTRDRSLELMTPWMRHYIEVFLSPTSDVETRAEAHEALVEVYTEGGDEETTRLNELLGESHLEVYATPDNTLVIQSFGDTE